MCDANAITHLIKETQPDEIYNLAAQSHVAVSFKMPMYTADVNATGTLILLEAVRLCGLQGKTRFYQVCRMSPCTVQSGGTCLSVRVQASTSELYGKVHEIPQDENTPFHPRSPYACAKLMAFWVTKNYREAYNMYACNGILFNHESPRRGEIFVTRKITMAIAAILAGRQESVLLGCAHRSFKHLLKSSRTHPLPFRNLDAQRDWGHARDYVKAMWAMLQQVRFSLSDSNRWHVN